jgi:hypothetical protein
MNVTPVVSGEGPVGDGCVVGLAAGLDAEPLGLAAPEGPATLPPLSGNPLASTAAPATTSATMMTIRAVPRFTARILPVGSFPQPLRRLRAYPA